MRILDFTVVRRGICRIQGNRGSTITRTAARVVACFTAGRCCESGGPVAASIRRALIIERASWPLMEMELG